MVMVLVLLGAPGAGKGTQAVRLSAELSLPHVSTGDLFRENRSRGTELGKLATEYMDTGKLVPDELVVDMLFDRVAREDCAAGYILDGFPRNAAQAEALDGRLDAAIDLEVIDIVAEDDVIVERVSGRLLCRENNHIHHLTFSPPREEGRCDTCGSELYRRDDDSPDVVRKRLAVYHEQTAPLERFYRERGVLSSVDGGGTSDEVFEACLRSVRGEA